MGQADAKALAAHVSAAAAGHRAFLTDPAIDRARRLQARAVAGWAMDCLALRRAGLDTPSVRRGTGELSDRAQLSGVGQMRSIASRRVPRWAPTNTRAA